MERRRKKKKKAENELFPIGRENEKITREVKKKNGGSERKRAVIS